MEIGNQIKTLRLRRGITQEAMAQHFGISPQAVSKWERGAAMPDIAMLPELSAYFGVTIDELFALSDDTRMERIQNMLWDVRYLNPADVENERAFLLEKAKREPKNGRPYALLADLENHLAQEHHDQAADYAKLALEAEPGRGGALFELSVAMRGASSDWYYANHYLLIDYYKGLLEKHPDCLNIYMVLLEQLIGDSRFAEAEEYLAEYAKREDIYRLPLYRAKLAWAKGQREEALAICGQMEADFPEDWLAISGIGDFFARAGEFDKARAYYRRAIDMQKAPRMLDPVEAMAMTCEIQGDIPAAIAAWEEELALYAVEWNTTAGECVDVIHRNIERLKAKL